MLHLLQMHPLKVLTALFSRFKNLCSSHSWSCLPSCVPDSSEDPTPTNTLTSSPDSSSLNTSTVLPEPYGPLLLMQHSHPILTFKSLIPSLYLFLLYPHHRFMFLTVFLHLLLPFPPLAPSGFFNGMLEVSKPGTLSYYTLFHLIMLTLFLSRNLTLIHLPLSEFLDSLIAPTPGLAFSLLIPCT